MQISDLGNLGYGATAAKSAAAQSESASKPSSFMWKPEYAQQNAERRAAEQQAAAAQTADAGFDWEKATPWILGGGALVVAAAFFFLPRK